jgi:hypothetical protein
VPIPHHQLKSNPIQSNKRAGTPNEDDGKGSKGKQGKRGRYESWNKKQEKWRYHWISASHLILPF